MRLDFARLAGSVYLSQHRIGLLCRYICECAAVNPRADCLGIFERPAIPFDIAFYLRE